MADVATHFPPQTYSSSFFLNALEEDEGSDKSKLHNKSTHDTHNLLDCFITKMMRLWIISLILFAYLLPLSDATGCVDRSPPKILTYRSLSDFQHNNKVLDPHNETFAGNWVTFDNGTIDTLPKNSFLTFQSNHIVRLFLNNHEIRQIDEGAFNQLDCMIVLQLCNNKIESISRPVFENMRHLKELDLSHNALQEVPGLTFRGNPQVTKLNLTGNRIRMLNTESFNNLSLLEVLDLSHNNLKTIHSSVFTYFYSLKILQLGSNELEEIEFNKMPKSGLTLLNLTSNNLESFDTSDVYPFASTLKELYLGDNLLTTLFRPGLKNFNSLKVIDIDDNPWFCANLYSLLTYFNDSKIDYKGSVNPGEGESHVGGIPCNQSVEEYRRKHKVEPTTLRPTPAPASSDRGNSSRLVNLQQFLKSNEEILNSLSSLYSIVVVLFVIVIIVILAELLYRGGCYWNNRRRRRHQQILDNADVENFSLLRERF